MIKWVGYGKLLKQSFFTLLISCFILLGGSFVSALDLAYTYQNGSYHSIGNDFEVAVYNRGMLGTNYLGNTKRMIGMYSSSSSTTKYRKYFWWNNGYAYFYYYYSGGNTVGKVVGKFNRYLLCEPITRSVVGTLTLSCGSYEDWGNGTFAEGFFSSITSSDYWGIYKGSSSSKDLRVCFSNSSYGKSICFSNSDAGNYYTISMDSDISYIDFPNSLLGDPPGRSTAGGNPSGSLPDGGIELDSELSAINYFENRYGRTKDICYAGVDSLSYLYGQNGISFNQGAGLSIFDIYSQLYGSGDLNHVSVWLNTWLVNRNQWFGTSGNPDYLVSYNSGTNLADFYWDNLTFPFANKPVAFYFLSDYIQSNSQYLTQGEEVVSYCSIKINSGTYNDILSDAVKNNINGYTQQSNKNNGLNADGSNIVIDFSNFGVYTGDSYTSSGIKIAFSGNTSIKNTLENFFSGFDSAFGELSSNVNVRILPTWIVYGFIFVVLFKFLRRRK